jgi:PAS domain S-box-containing protein
MQQLALLLVFFLLFLPSLYFFISARKEKKQFSKLSKDADNYSNIINQANDAMLVIDLVDGRIHQCNPAACSLLGYSEKDLLKKTLFNLHPYELLNKSSQVIADTWEKGGHIYDDIPFITSTGELLPVECSSKVAPYSGRPAIVVYARDIRERLALENKIKEQRRLIDEKSKDIRDSIDYANRIQNSFLLDEKQIRTHIDEAFIFFQPRDVVSGDFYWFLNYTLGREVISESGMVYKQGSRILVMAAADCTGHGVPGAFMSMILNSLLDQTALNQNVRSPAAALDFVNAGLKKHLNKNHTGQPLRDGMDIALCSIDFDGLQMEFAGANNPVYLIRNSELIVLSADKQPLTASPDAEIRPFVNTKVELQKGDCIYAFTDGYADQFGGEKGKKYLYKRFKDFLIEIHQKPMAEQKLLLLENFAAWKGNADQIDDVLVMGVRI